MEEIVTQIKITAQQKEDQGACCQLDDSKSRNARVRETGSNCKLYTERRKNENTVILFLFIVILLLLLLLRSSFFKG